MVELLFQNVLTKNIMLVKTDVFDVNKKVQKGPEATTPICLANKKLEGVDLRRKMQGLRNHHLLYGPSW